MRQISVILPIYNVEPYLDTAIRSVCAQTYADWEMLLVDDGSTDGSALICEKWAQSDERIRVIRKENGGVSTARNAGIEEAGCAYLFFLDPDDYIHPQTFETLLQLAQSYDADVAIGFTRGTDRRDYAEPDRPQYAVRTASGKQATEYLYGDGGESMRFFGYNPTCVLGKLYARSLFRTIRFDPDARMAEDLTIAPYLLDAAKTVVSTDRRLYYVYHRPGSLTRTAPQRERAESLTRTVCRMYPERLRYFREKRHDGYETLLRATYRIAFFDLIGKRTQFRAFPACRRLLRRTLRAILRQLRCDRAVDLPQRVKWNVLFLFPFVFSLAGSKRAKRNGTSA